LSHFFQGYLRPSRELLEFYRRKIAQYDNERDDMIQKLDRCKVAHEEKVLVVFILQTLVHIENPMGSIFEFKMIK
jgi:hypothetical protein